MTESPTANRLIDLIVDVLRIPRTDVVDTLDMEETSTWDSLSHMQLIAAIEDEFGIELTADDIVAMRSVGQIKEIVRARTDGT